ncbi:MAG TPA: DUF1223 domain-containing protein [Paracoccaceae bacterium]|nr:DUF1223 domain-containing protein [Paracoccaceae bacterium]
MARLPCAAYGPFMLLLPRTILLAALALPVAAMADGADNVVMVELFTSQGCSSCPPADEHLAKLAERDDVLALSMHVDYWDYLGWQDTFAQAEHTLRQAEYRDRMGARVLFTPQMIIDGARSVPGVKHDMVEAAIEAAAKAPHEAGISLDQQDGMLRAEITGEPGPWPSTIWVASYDREATVEIERGENAGRTFTYRNVVEKLMKVGPWDGDGPASLPLPQPAPGEGIAVWLQDERSGRILAASYIEDGQED